MNAIKTVKMTTVHTTANGTSIIVAAWQYANGSIKWDVVAGFNDHINGLFECYLGGVPCLDIMGDTKDGLRAKMAAFIAKAQQLEAKALATIA